MIDSFQENFLMSNALWAYIDKNRGERLKTVVSTQQKPLPSEQLRISTPKTLDGYARIQSNIVEEPKVRYASPTHY